MARYWIGDLHLGHLKVSQIRGFATPDDHDAALLKQLYELKAGDVLYILGDNSSGRDFAEERALELLEGLKLATGIIIHFIAGNHDSVSSIHKDGWKSQGRYFEVFDSVRDYGRFALEGENVLMSHFPYAALGDGDGRVGPPRYLPYRLADVGLPLVHAHTHQDHPFSLLRPEMLHPVPFDGYDLGSICVSWDARRGLTTEADMTSWLQARSQVKHQLETEKVQSYWSSFPKPGQA